MFAEANPHSLAGSLFLKENKSHFKPNLMDKIEARAKETKYQSWSKPRSAHKIVTIFFACFKTGVWMPWWKENSKAVEARAVPWEYVYSPTVTAEKRVTFVWICNSWYVCFKNKPYYTWVIYLMFSFMFPLKHSTLIYLWKRDRERERSGRDLPEKDHESSITTSLSPFLDRIVPDVWCIQLEGNLPLKTKTLRPNKCKG